jgi:hypothetical protein
MKILALVITYDLHRLLDLTAAHTLCCNIRTTETDKQDVTVI